MDALQSGSSPRAWGIHPKSGESPIAARFIPTCVGNTGNECRMKIDNAVHPHVRGEYNDIRVRIITLSGSSPRAWGIREGRAFASADGRFIPTCVGNTSAWPSSPPHAAVHPHVRGEYDLVILQLTAETGSSPRAWGIQFSDMLRTA